MCLFVSNRVVDKINGQRVVVTTTCGHCVECLKRRQNDWKLRICHECLSWSHIYFFTLTYRPDMLPCNVVDCEVEGEVLYSGRFPDCHNYCVDNYLDNSFRVVSTCFKPDVQNFIKRIREDISRKIGSRWKMKYFICSEYGPNPRGTKRPHYHGILLCNEDYNTLRPYFNIWENDFGRIDFQEVGLGRKDRSSVSNYISKYCAKGCFESRQEDIDHKHINRTFSLISKNIGLDWLEKHKQDYLKFVPESASIPGNWSEEDFLRIVGTDLYYRTQKEIDALIRNFKICDGDNFKYRMPRYYFDRIINKVDYYDRITNTNIPNLRIGFGCLDRYFISLTEPITFKTKKVRVKRFSSESFLSRALAYRMALLSASRDFANIEKFKNDYGYEDFEAVRVLSRDKQNALEYRSKSAWSSLSNFYTSNMWKHREFDE